MGWVWKLFSALCPALIGAWVQRQAKHIIN
jgi:hypothetical protein